MPAIWASQAREQSAKWPDAEENHEKLEIHEIEEVKP
jgi:hypothetical protein